MAHYLKPSLSLYLLRRNGKNVMARKRQQNPKQQLIAMVGPLAIVLIGLLMVFTGFHRPVINWLMELNRNHMQQVHDEQVEEKAAK